MSWNVHVCWLKPSINPFFHDGYVAAVAHTLCGSRDVTLKCNSPVSAVLAVRQWVLHIEKNMKKWLLTAEFFLIFPVVCFLLFSCSFQLLLTVLIFLVALLLFLLFLFLFGLLYVLLSYDYCFLCNFKFSILLYVPYLLFICFSYVFFLLFLRLLMKIAVVVVVVNVVVVFFFPSSSFDFAYIFFLLVPLVFSVPWPVSVAKSQGQDQMARCDVDVSHAQLQACWKRWQTGQHWPENGDELGMVHWLCHIHKRSSWPLHSTIVAIVIKRTNLYEQVSKKALVQIGLTSAHSFTPKVSK